MALVVSGHGAVCGNIFAETRFSPLKVNGAILFFCMIAK